jgi:hypothetical protein
VRKGEVISLGLNTTRCPNLWSKSRWTNDMLLQTAHLEFATFLPKHNSREARELKNQRHAQDTMKHFEKYMVKERLPCIHMGALLTHLDMEDVDVLTIDTEGADYALLWALPLPRAMLGLPWPLVRVPTSLDKWGGQEYSIISLL